MDPLAHIGRDVQTAEDLPRRLGKPIARLLDREWHEVMSCFKVARAIGKQADTTRCWLSRMLRIAFDIPRWVLVAVAAATMNSAMAQSPVIAAYGYSRATLPGIPGEAENQRGTQVQTPFPPTYYLYVELKKGTRVSASCWAWLGENHHSCTLKKVRTPVLVESDPVVATGKKDTLVPKTANDVYRVILGEVKGRAASNSEASELIRNNEAVIALIVDKSSAYATIKSLTALKPAAAM